MARPARQPLVTTFYGIAIPRDVAIRLVKKAREAIEAEDATARAIDRLATKLTVPPPPRSLEGFDGALEQAWWPMDSIEPTESADLLVSLIQLVQWMSHMQGAPVKTAADWCLALGHLLLTDAEIAKAGFQSEHAVQEKRSKMIARGWLFPATVDELPHAHRFKH